MSHSWPLVQMERFDACVEFHTLYEYCGCKFEELKHNELHHGIKKICHFVQPHYARIPEECNMRAEEDINDLNFDDRALVYDYRERYCELLSKISCEDLAICCVCRCRGGPESKRLSCNHAIHNASHLRRWLSSVPPEEHECPRCKEESRFLRCLRVR